MKLLKGARWAVPVCQLLLSVPGLLLAKGCAANPFLSICLELCLGCTTSFD